MPRSILIVERHREVAEALEQVIASADHAPIVRTHMDDLDEIHPAPAVIVLRIVFEGGSEPLHACVERLPKGHPPVIAIVRADEEASEAERIKCDVVLRAPHDLRRLREIIASLTQ